MIYVDGLQDRHAQKKTKKNTIGVFEVAEQLGGVHVVLVPLQALTSLGRKDLSSQMVHADLWECVFNLAVEELIFFFLQAIVDKYATGCLADSP